MDVITFSQTRKLMESFIDYEIENNAVQLMANFLNESLNEICKEFPSFKTDVITPEIINKIFENPEIINKVYKKFSSE